MRILFVTANRLGDAVLSTGILGWLADRHPGARFWIASGSVAAPLFGGVPGCERVLEIRKRRYSGHWLDLWRQIRGVRWDLVVDLRASALSCFVRTRRRVISGKADPALHRVEYLGHLLGLSDPPAPRLWETETARQRAAELIPGGAPVLALGPAANWRGKQWQAGRFAETATQLTGPGGALEGARIAIFAAENERAQVAPVLDAIPAGRRIDLVGATDPLEAYSCLLRCALYVGNDSGLMHLSAASGIPTLGLFGPSREQHYRPWGDNCAFVRTALAYEDLVGGPGYDHRTTGTLMDSLSVDAVTEAATGLWNRTRRAA